jgi:hypothetical protein
MLCRIRLTSSVADVTVILSGGPGYRFSQRVSVQYAGKAIIKGLQGHVTSNADAVDPLSGPVSGPVCDSDDPVTARRKRVLQAVIDGQKLRAPGIAKQVGCSVRTAKRDLEALNSKVEFLGSPRTGHYRLRDGEEQPT